MNKSWSLVLALAVVPAWANECIEWLPIFIPTPRQCSEPATCPGLPAVPEGCTHYTSIQPSISVADWQTLQFHAGPWLQEVQHVIEVDQSQCQWDSWSSRWNCTVSWDVPTGAWWWQWTDNQVPLGTQRCVWDI